MYTSLQRFSQKKMGLIFGQRKPGYKNPADKHFPVEYIITMNGQSIDKNLGVVGTCFSRSCSDALESEEAKTRPYFWMRFWV